MNAEDCDISGTFQNMLSALKSVKLYLPNKGLKTETEVPRHFNTRYSGNITDNAFPSSIHLALEKNEAFTKTRKTRCVYLSEVLENPR